MIPQYTLSLVDMWIHVMLKVNIGNNFGYIYKYTTRTSQGMLHTLKQDLNFSLQASKNYI